MSNLDQLTERDFRISRVIPSVPARVFTAWADRGHVQRWWGPGGFNMRIPQWEGQLGGSYRMTLLTPDGAEYTAKGRFLEWKPGERVVMTMDCSEHPLEWHDAVNPERVRSEPPRMDMVLTAEFADAGSGSTNLTLNVRFETAAICARMVGNGMGAAWGLSLDRLAAVLARPTFEREMVISRIVRAPRELVFKVWTDPRHVSQWWGPNGFTTTTLAHDLRPGGIWRFIMHGPDGTDWQNRITYREVVPPERLAYQHGNDVEVELFTAETTFDTVAGGTQITLCMTMESAQSRALFIREVGALEGGTQTLERFEAALAKLA